MILVETSKPLAVTVALSAIYRQPAELRAGDRVMLVVPPTTVEDAVEIAEFLIEDGWRGVSEARVGQIRVHMNSALVVVENAPEDCKILQLAPLAETIVVNSVPIYARYRRLKERLESLLGMALSRDDVERILELARDYFEVKRERDYVAMCPKAPRAPDAFTKRLRAIALAAKVARVPLAQTL
ncbi:MAG: hypothetical protein QXP36_00665 [Conexivisphaerales archaeon]